MGWLSKEYAEEYVGQRGQGKKVSKQDDFVSKFLPNIPSLVLDAGGGNGRWSLGFYELGYEVCLVDFNIHMLKMAQAILSKTGVHIVLADIRSLPFRSEAFNFILCEADPISQCGSKGEVICAIKSIHSVLKKGSIMVGSLSNRYFWFIKMMVGVKDEADLEEVLQLLDSGVYMPRVDAHMYLFSPNEFVDEMKKAGFQVLELIPYVGLIASEFIAKEKGCLNSRFAQRLNEIENRLQKDKQSLYFSRRFRFAVRKNHVAVNFNPIKIGTVEKVDARED